jgi:taurine dioxygenase
MAFTTITATPVSPHVGAEIIDIDLTKPLSNQQVRELHDALTQYLVLFFRDQVISHGDQIRLGQYFGKLGEHVGAKTKSKKTENPLINQFHYDETTTKIAGEVWHSDQTCASVPPLGSILYNHTVPPNGGGDTMFASMYAAYDALSPRMKSYLEGLTATHDGVKVFGPGTPLAVHPVITRHPVSKKKVIFVNSSFTTKINELPALEGDRVLKFLVDHVSRPEWTCRFRWRAHSIAFWDNRCTQHYAISDYWPQVRSGYRIQIEGTAPPEAA